MEDLGNAIEDSVYRAFQTEDESGEVVNVTDGLFAIAQSLNRVADALNRLGNADAATPMGAMEALGAVLKEDLTNGLVEIAEAIREKED